MVNTQLYQEVLACLRDTVHRKRPELWENQTWMLHHNNVPAHASLLIPSYLAKTSDIRCAPSTLFSRLAPIPSRLSSADIFLFPKLKTTLKGRCFHTTEEIQENAIRELRAITESAFQEAFQQWKKC